MVDIEKGALGTLEQDALPRAGEIAEYLRDVGRHRRNDFGRGERLVESRVEIDCIGAEIILQQKVVVVEHFAQLRSEIFTHEQVRHAQRSP